jgi:hypothetical protein
MTCFLLQFAAAAATRFFANISADYEAYLTRTLLLKNPAAGVVPSDLSEHRPWNDFKIGGHFVSTKSLLSGLREAADLGLIVPKWIQGIQVISLLQALTACRSRRIFPGRKTSFTPRG